MNEKGNARRGDGGDFSFMLLLFSLDSSKLDVKFSLLDDCFERFFGRKDVSPRNVTVFSREICTTYIAH